MQTDVAVEAVAIVAEVAVPAAESELAAVDMDLLELGRKSKRDVYII